MCRVCNSPEYDSYLLWHPGWAQVTKPRRTAPSTSSFFHDAPAMGLLGVEAQVESVGAVLVAVAFGEELIDLALAVGERVESVVDFWRIA